MGTFEEVRNIITNDCKYSYKSYESLTYDSYKECFDCYSFISKTFYGSLSEGREKLNNAKANLETIQDSYNSLKDYLESPDFSNNFKADGSSELDSNLKECGLFEDANNNYHNKVDGIIYVASTLKDNVIGLGRMLPPMILCCQNCVKKINEWQRYINGVMQNLSIAYNDQFDNYIFYKNSLNSSSGASVDSASTADSANNSEISFEQWWNKNPYHLTPAIDGEIPLNIMKDCLKELEEVISL